MIAAGMIVAFIQSTAAIFPRRDALSESAERGCPQGDQQACQEMYATIRAANAADDIVDLAVWQFVAGLVGVYLIARTLKATRDAVTEANEATEAARRAVQATEEGNRRQLQAYVHVERAEINWSDMAASHPSITLFVKNSGQTPAKWFGVSVIVLATDHLVNQSTFDNAEWQKRELIRWSALAGMSDVSIPGNRVDDVETLSKAYSSQMVVNVMGAVRYETMFGEIVETEFWFCRKPQHRYRYTSTDNALSLATYGVSTETPVKMQRVAVALRTYQPIAAA